MKAQDCFAPLFWTLIDVVHPRQGQSAANGERDVVGLKSRIYFQHIHQQNTVTYVSYLKVVSELVKSGKPRVRRAHYQRRRIGDAEASPDGLHDNLDGVGHEERRDHDDV